MSKSSPEQVVPVELPLIQNNSSQVEPCARWGEEEKFRDVTLVREDKERKEAHLAPL